MAENGLFSTAYVSIGCVDCRGCLARLLCLRCFGHLQIPLHHSPGDL